MINYKGVPICQDPDEITFFKNELNNIGEGDLAEVGVYYGGTAKIMAERYPDRDIYIFDTFEGLPDWVDNEVGDSDVEKFKTGDMKEATLKIVKENLKEYKNIHIYKGVFPETSEPIKDKKFAFVHIDTDIYKSTKLALDFFIPRAKVIIIHDYPIFKGVRKAVDECGKKVETHNLRQGIIR